MSALMEQLFARVRQSGVIIGGVLLVLLLLSFASGIVLAFFYNPSPAGVYESMRTIVGVPLLAFIRNIHYWSSDLLVFLLFLHMTRVAITKPTGRARKYAWWFGVAFLFVIGIEMTIGRFLRADQEAFDAYTHFFLGTSGIVAGYIPFAADIANAFSGSTALFRFFILHAVAIPVGIVALALVHYLFAPTFRSMVYPMKKAAESSPTPNAPSGWKRLMAFPSMRNLLGLSGSAIAIVLTLSLIAPAPFFPSPFAGLEVTKPSWWIMWIVALENVWGLMPILLAPPVLFLALLAVPVYTKDRPGPDLGTAIYGLSVAVILVLGMWATNAPQVAHTEHFRAEAGIDAHAGHTGH
ncbi:MAG TPA: cytochrome b N-terminal domain-containing protein [Candidatus Paceibacterota bacterium]|nr:cytochrome b N-terminal domain-containing protein [Candidatus Paceibacterota bacterium]